MFTRRAARGGLSVLRHAIKELRSFTSDDAVSRLALKEQLIGIKIMAMRS
jgi:hypothetical protein